MITEILRNQAQSLEERKDEIGTIIFDEAHYLGSRDRGAVWENSIINAVPNDIQTLYLSATLGNGKDFQSWIKELNPSQKVSRVEANTSERFVPLTYSVYDPNAAGKKFVSVVDGNINLASLDEGNLTDRQKRALEEIYKTQNDKSAFYEMSDNEFIMTARNLKIKLEDNYKPAEFKEALSEIYPKLDDSQKEKITQLLLSDKTIDKVHVAPLEKDDFSTLVEDLKADDKLPALIFKLSQKGCDSIINDLNNPTTGVNLTTEDEKEQIREIIADYKARGVYLGEKFDEETLLKGFASHHAGKLPGYRKLVEDLFSKKLIKVVSATSTLSAGINMPVRTVVMSDVTYKKYNPQTQSAEFTTLTASDFHQMAGRAGRRGIDSIGHVVLYNLYTDTDDFFEDENDVDKKGHNALGFSQVPKDKLNFAYDLITTKAEPLKSNFLPEPCMMAQYYSENTNNDNLKDEINKSFRVHIARDSKKEEKNLIKKFENYSTILAKNGYVEKNHKNEIKLTPKGIMLQHSMGANPLMLSSLVYDKKLDVNPELLAQIAGYISNGSAQEEDENSKKLINHRLSSLLAGEDDKTKQINSFNEMSLDYKSIEDKILKANREARVPLENIIQADSFGGFVAYMWAHYNKQNPDCALENFSRLINEALEPMELRGSRLQDPEFGAKIEFLRKATEGNTYKILSQSVSVLKQIERMAEFALNNPDEYPDSAYYQNLKENASIAVELMNKQPVGDELAV